MICLSVKSFYHLHVHKTCGRFFKTYVIKDIKQIITDSSPRSLPPNWSHYGWHNLISDNTYIVSSLRDPVEVSVSYMLQHYDIKNKDDFFQRMNKVNNIQSKHFINWENNMVDVEKQMGFDKNLILSRLQRVDLLIDSKDININSYNDIRKKIVSDMGLKNVHYDDKKEDTNKYRNNGVKEFCNSLTEKEIFKIKEINYMDVELYEAAKNLFYRFN